MYGTLRHMTILCLQVEGFVGRFVGVLSALYCSLDNRQGEGCHRICLGSEMQLGIAD